MSDDQDVLLGKCKGDGRGVGEGGQSWYVI